MRLGNHVAAPETREAWRARRAEVQVALEDMYRARARQRAEERMDEIRITVTGGPYEGKAWEGKLLDLRNAPTTVLIPEGIVSDRTVREAERIRAAIARYFLAGSEALTISAAHWSLRVERLGLASELRGEEGD